MTNIEEAIQRIEKSKNLAGVSLNLENLGLTTEDLERLIPIIAGELPNLSYLHLDNNSIEYFPENIVHLSNLLDFSCSNNNLKSLSGIEKLRNLSRLFLKNNAISMVSSSIVSLPDLYNVFLFKNPLSLISLLNISTVAHSQEKFLLDSSHTNMLNLILEEPRVKNLATSVAVDYPDIRIEQFNILYQSLNTDYPDISVEQLNNLYQSLSATEIQGIVEFELSLSELGIVLESNGNLSNDLPLRHTNAELSELLDKTEEIMQITGKTSHEAFLFAKNKSAIYLDGILNYGLSEGQMNQLDSDEKIKDIYRTINEKISERHSSNEKKQSLTNSTDEEKEQDLANLNEDDKALAREIFNEIIGKYTSEKTPKATALSSHTTLIPTFSLDSLAIALNAAQSKPKNNNGNGSDNIPEKKPAHTSKLSW